jgi:transposase
MITIGVDAHKRLHVAVAVDGAGRRAGEWRGPNSPGAWDEAIEWARGLGGGRMWGIEGAWGYGRGLAQRLVEQGERVSEVNPRLTAQGRRRARRTDKSDRLDAEAVARVTLREHEALPPVSRVDQTEELDLLSRERDAAVAEATRIRNRIHFLLSAIDPLYKDKMPPLAGAAGLKALLSYSSPSANTSAQMRAGLVRKLAERLAMAVAHAKEIAEQVRRLTSSLRPLLSICGISSISAGAIAGALGPGRRFATDARLASYAGAAPLEASSSGAIRHRLNRNGDRRLNAILHRIALTQSRAYPPAITYLRRRMAEGKTRAEATRALKRYIARAVHRAWGQCDTSKIGLQTRDAHPTLT